MSKHSLSGAFNLVGAAVYVTSTCINAFNGRESRKLQGELEEKRRETQLQIEYLKTINQRDMEGYRQAFQEKMTKYQCKQNRRLQEFIKAVDIAIAKSNQDFQAWLFEKQKALQQELAVYNRQTQLEIAAYQRETVRHTEEFRKLLENWPLRLVPAQIIDSYQGEGAVPLRIIPAPPEIDYDRFGKATADFPRLEKRLARGLKKFLDRYYPIESKDRPTELLDSAWDSNRFWGGASIKALFGMLKSEPTLVLESEVEGDVLNLNVAYWSEVQESYSYKTVAVDFPYRNILDWSAKTRATEWKTTIRDVKLAEGLSLEQINKLYGGENNPINLEIWELEERDKQQGIEYRRNYAYHAKDGETLCRFLTAVHCLLAGLFADVHYLIHYNLDPQLPAALPELMADFLDSRIARNMVDWVVRQYRDIFEKLEADRSHLIPDLTLQLAEGLTGLKDKSWARELVNDSMRYCLQLRGIVPSHDLLTQVKSALVIQDMNYVQRLNRCLLDLGDENQLNLAEACYNRGIQRCSQQDYLAAIADFDQAIQISPNWVEAYYNRGLARIKLEEYEAAIYDYTALLRLQPTHAKAYNNRGNAYYKLEDYEAAIADYDWAIELGFSSAQKNRNIALGAWAELNRKREEEERIGEAFEFEVATVYELRFSDTESAGIATELSRKQGRVLKKNLGNKAILEMVYIRGGTFMMGSPDSEEGRRSNEGPQHQVTVASFFMGKYPITQAQWEAVMGNNPSWWKGANLPVNEVSWYDAVEFCQQLSQKTGKTYRLPSEAEWEYACRAGTRTTTPFHFGDTITADLVSYNRLSCSMTPDELSIVGSFGVANAFGLYDMHGNVWEWCADPWHENYQGAPFDGSVWDSEGDYSSRLLRGGCSIAEAENCRSASRNSCNPASGHCFFSFRVVCVSPVQTL